MAHRDYEREVRGVLERTNADVRASEARGEFAEARRVLASATRDLRDIKRDLTALERSIREDVRDARLQNNSSGQTVGMFMGSKARGAMARARASENRKLSQKQADALRPITAFKTELDRIIAGLDREKARFADAATQSRPGTTTPAAAQTANISPSPPPPPHWAPDPVRRHQHRFWDGQRWTEHVADAGSQSIDPLP